MRNLMIRASDRCLDALMPLAARYEAFTGSSVLRVAAAFYAFSAGSALAGGVARIVAAHSLNPMLGLSCALDLGWAAACGVYYVGASSDAEREESMRPHLTTPSVTRLTANGWRPYALLFLVLSIARFTLDLLFKHRLPDLAFALSMFDDVSVFLAVHLHSLPPRPPSRRREATRNLALSAT